MREPQTLRTAGRTATPMALALVCLLLCLVAASLSAAPHSPSVVTEGAEVPGTRLYASTQAYGEFRINLPNGETITIPCDGIPGISGVLTEDAVSRNGEGRPSVALRRLVTHFHQDLGSDHPLILIEQDHERTSTGELTGHAKGGAGALLPGTARFDQYIIIYLDGRALTNREPLTLIADQVKSWPPLGSSFQLQGPTAFYDLDDVRAGNPAAAVVGTLDACNVEVREELTLLGE
ncbi:MAG: hypothetical protein AAF481_12745 [Acidobacteriota bacterium]